MIDITKHIKINILTVILFTLCSFFHYPVIFYITYAVMVLHEAAHTLAAVCIGLKVDYVALQPFGLNLRLKNKMVPSLAEEIILYLSGPLVNAAAAFVSAMLYIKYGVYTQKLFSMTNLALFIINLLPAVPLDGGYILRAILIRLMAYRTAFITSSIVSVIICAFITALGVYAAYRSHNFSVLLFASLIIGGLLTQRAKYEYEQIGAAALGYMPKRL